MTYQSDPKPRRELASNIGLTYHHLLKNIGVLQFMRDLHVSKGEAKDDYVKVPGTLFWVAGLAIRSNALPHAARTFGAVRPESRVLVQ